MCGYYSIPKGRVTIVYHHSIRKFDLTKPDGKEKQSAYKFTKNVYDIWMPKHLYKMSSVIDELSPDFNFEVPQLPEESGVSQDLEGHYLSRSSKEL